MKAYLLRFQTCEVEPGNGKGDSHKVAKKAGDDVSEDGDGFGNNFDDDWDFYANNKIYFNTMITNAWCLIVDF